MKTIPLVRAAVVREASKFRPKTTGTCSVYVLITRESDGFGVYVGQTGKPPEERYEEHLLEYKSGKAKEVVDRVRAGMAHLSGISREEAEKLEVKLGGVLGRAGVMVRGAH